MGQRVAVTGLGLDNFQDILEGIRNINDTFMAEVPPEKFQGIEPTEVDGMTCIRFANRFLTPKSMAEQTVHTHSSMLIIDPYSHLKRAAGNKYVHTDDNVVKYFKKRQFVDGEKM